MAVFVVSRSKMPMIRTDWYLLTLVESSFLSFAPPTGSPQVMRYPLQLDGASKSLRYRITIVLPSHRGCR